MWHPSNPACGGPRTGALAPTLIEHAVQLAGEIEQKHVQFESSRNGRQDGQITTALGEHGAQPLAGFEDPLDEHDVLVLDLEASDDEAIVDEFGEEQAATITRHSIQSSRACASASSGESPEEARS